MTIEERLELVEKELKNTRRHNRHLLGLILLVFSIGIIGATTLNSQQEVRAKIFTLVDENGLSRARLFMTDGEPAFTMSDAKGTIRAMLSTSVDGPAFILADENGKVRASLAMLGGLPSLSLYGPDGNKHVFLNCDVNGNFSLSGEKGQVALGVSVDGPLFVLADEKGNPRSELCLKNDLPQLILFDGNGKNRSMLGLSQYGPVLALADGNGTPRVSLCALNNPGDSRLNLSDENGKTVWSAP